MDNKKIGKPKTCRFLMYAMLKLVLFVAYVLCVCGVKLEVADRSNEGVNAESKGREPEVCRSSAGVAFGLKSGVIDDDTADPS